MTTVPAPTFRDPAGYVEFTEHEVLRHVHPASAERTRRFLRSGVVQRWQASGQMIPAKAEEQGMGLVLRHPRVFFPSYPWEWSPAQWRSAADLTLELCTEAIPAGFLLKDATPLNILLDGCRPVFVDVLSFDPRTPENPLWLAQGQFIRTFLLPLLAYRYLGWPLAASQNYRDGYEPSQLAEALGPVRRLHPRLLWPVTLPAWLENRQKTASKPAGSAHPLPRSARAFTSAILLKNLRQLGRRIAGASTDLKLSHWSEYTRTANHYSAEDHSRKKEFVARVLGEIHPATVLDIGANTGTYSMLAALAGARVVALDTDVAAIDRLWLRASGEARDILPLVIDLARPSPAVGWENAESMSFLGRAEQRFDLVMMLAIIHHLLLMDQIPLEQIAALAARLTRRHLLLEWVPKTDPMFQRLLRGRDAIYEGLTLDHMQTAFSLHFSITGHCDLSNGRTLISMKKL